jgi:hypothetical protein
MCKKRLSADNYSDRGAPKRIGVGYEDRTVRGIDELKVDTQCVSTMLGFIPTDNERGCHAPKAPNTH